MTTTNRWEDTHTHPHGSSKWCAIRLGEWIIDAEIYSAPRNGSVIGSVTVHQYRQPMQDFEISPMFGWYAQTETEAKEQILNCWRQILRDALTAAE